MIERMKELVTLLNKASQAYYQEDREIMSNQEYDKLYDELIDLETKTGIKLANTPTEKVGYTVLSDLKKVKHESKMLSLDKTKEIDKLKSFLGTEEGLISWKLDGLTIVLNYNNGELVQAVTRGNGEIGEDITHNAKVFKNIPLKLNFKNELVLRGEAVISYSEFKKINENIDDIGQYKNPRNLCSGTVRQLNSEIAAQRNVMFFAFTLVKAESKDFEFKENQLEWLKELGFDVVEYQKVKSNNIEQIVKHFEAKIQQNDFASDGLVLTYNDIKYSETLGTTSKFPKDSIAFKWADEMAYTTFISIEWNTSRTGRINPIAIFEPVELEGTTVNRASLHNLNMIEILNLRKGDKIKVYKANMIIPQIAENCSYENMIPNKCPVCGEEAQIRKTHEEKVLYCTNPSCKAQLVRSLEHFTSRDAANIEGLSEATLEKFVSNGFIKDYTDIYNLKNYEDQIKTMEGFGEKSYQNLINAVEKSKIIELPNLIYALGINNVGLSNAKLLCKNYDYDYNKIIEAQEEDLLNIEGFGEIIAHEIFKYFNNVNNRDLFYKVIKFLKLQKPSQEDKQNLDNITFVITGNLTLFKNRKELQAKIESLGGKVTSSVTSKTNYLINNDVHSDSSKNKNAKNLNIPIITEQEFLDLISSTFN